MKEEDIRKRDVFNCYLKLVREDCQIFFDDKSNFIEVDCPACGGQTHLLQFNKNGFEYVTCNVCQTLYARIRPTFKKIQSFYTKSKSTSYWINEFFKPMADARREKIFRPRAEYIVERFGKDPAWLIGDIGAGFGLFLQELRKYWQSSRYIAIEPSLEQADICRQACLQVECCALEEIKDYNGYFDLLTSFELLEHVYDPIFFLDSVHQLLKPGGWFLITTLNGHGFDIQVLWEKSKSVTPPHHLNFFNPASMRHLLERLGFEVIEISTPGKLDWDIIEGMITHDRGEPGRFWKLLSERGTIEAKLEFQDWIRRHHFSSHMQALVRKQT